MVEVDRNYATYVLCPSSLNWNVLELSFFTWLKKGGRSLLLFTKRFILFHFDIHIWEWPIFACQVYFQEYRPGVTSFCIVFICCCCAFMINWLRCSLLCLDCFEVVSGSVSFLFPFFCTRGFLYLTRIGTSTSIQTCLFSVLLSELESDWKKKA